MTNELYDDLNLQQLTNHLAKPCLFFIGKKIIVDSATMNPMLSFQQTVDALSLRLNSSFLDGTTIIIECQSASTPEEFSTLGYVAYQVNQFLPKVDTDNQFQILRAFHWLNWHKQSKPCGKCGKILKVGFDTTEKKCAACDLSFFPRFSPAVLVLIHHEDKILLARSPHFPPGDYSAIAGFIDVGESAEQAAHREVKEELGIEITDLEYFSSQTWPFPDSFMIAFKARYLRGEVTPDLEEIEDARWFSKSDLPNLTPSASIARKLIKSFALD